MTWFVLCGKLWLGMLNVDYFTYKHWPIASWVVWKTMGFEQSLLLYISITIVQKFLNYNEIGIIYLCILYSQIKQLVILFDLCYYISRKKNIHFPEFENENMAQKHFLQFLGPPNFAYKFFSLHFKRFKKRSYLILRLFLAHSCSFSHSCNVIKTYNASLLVD